jgi:hypothetical protein
VVETLRFALNRFAHSATDFDRILIHCECHVAFESPRPGDDDAHAASEAIDPNPGLMWAGGLLSTGGHRRLDTLTPSGRDAFAVKYG